MKRAITGFHLDRFQEWVADLECGHGVTMKHNPPYQSCSWIGSAVRRNEHVGDLQECVTCDMPTLPDNVHLVETSPLYRREAMPEEFGSGYSVAGGQWAKVIVKKGLLQFLILSEPTAGFVLDECLPGVIAPGVIHELKPAMGEVEFYLEFYQPK
jgi:tellurite resistance-related uncharacterized protein